MISDPSYGEGALGGVRVVDFTDALAGAFATKLLADFGADVVKVEPPTGDPVRMLAPFKDDIPDPERSGLFFLLNTNKRSVVLDLEDASGRERALALASTADLVIESFAPGRMAALGLGHEALSARNPATTLVSISNFGQDGPYRDFAGSELTLFAMGGEMHSIGLADRYPLKLGGNASLYYAGAMAAVAAAGALVASRRHGFGQHVDLSIFEAHLASVDRRMSALLAYQFCGATTPRSGDDGEAFPGGVFACADGFVQLYSNAGQWDRTVAMLGNPPELLDEKWKAPGARGDPERVAEFMGLVYGWLYERTKAEVWEATRKAQLICGPLNTIADLVGDRPLRDRGFWAEVDHAALGRVRLPGRPAVWSETPWSLRRPAPLLGEHTAEVLEEVAVLEQSTKASRAATAGVPATPPARSPERPLPLAGVRVVDLCASWAGPFITQLLGDLGAEVIKVENTHVWQPMGRGHMARPTAEGLRAMVPWSGGYPGWEPGERPWNRNPGNLPSLRNKLSMTCDLRTAEGKEVLSRLVAVSDIVVENNVTETMDKLGVTYEFLKAARPDIIFVRGPGFGNTGERKDLRGVGSSMEAFAGHTLLRCYPDLGPMTLTSIYPSDAFAGLHGAFGALAALAYRDRTGKGQVVETAQAECAIGMLPEYVMDYLLNGRLHESLANRDFHGAAPSGVYPCADDDRWVAVTVRSDEEWRALCETMARPDLGDDGRLATAEGRRWHHDEIDAAIAAWTAVEDVGVVFHRLQARGIASGPVMDAADCFRDPHLIARGFFEVIDHAETGKYPWPGMPFKLSSTPLSIRKPPPNLGEHNEYAYKGVLGYSDADYERLEREGQIGTEYDAGIP